MSQSNYSKVEKNEIDIPYSKMIALLGRLNMNVDEFIYIHRGYEKNASNHSNLLQLEVCMFQNNLFNSF